MKKVEIDQMENVQGGCLISCIIESIQYGSDPYLCFWACYYAVEA